MNVDHPVFPSLTLMATMVTACFTLSLCTT